MTTEKEAAIARLREAERGLDEALTEMGNALSNLMSSWGDEELVHTRTADNVARLQRLRTQHLRHIEQGLSRRPEEPVWIEKPDEFPGSPFLLEPDKDYLEMVRKSLGPRFRVWAHRVRRFDFTPDWVISAALVGWPDKHQSAVLQGGAGRRQRGDRNR